MSNPHPVKQRQSDVMSDRIKAKFAKYAKRKRQPGEATTRIVNTFAKNNLYRPPVWPAPIR